MQNISLLSLIVFEKQPILFWVVVICMNNEYMDVRVTIWNSEECGYGNFEEALGPSRQSYI